MDNKYISSLSIADRARREHDPKSFERLDQLKRAAAIERAQTESKNGYVQHVNRTRDGHYVVSDWFDGSTIASFENGRQL